MEQNINRVNKYLYKVTRKEYIAFCLEVMGLYVFTLDSYVRSSEDLGTRTEERYIGDIKYMWDSGFKLEGIKWNLAKYNLRILDSFTYLELKSMVESFKDPFIEAHTGEVDIYRFYSSPAVSEFKSKIFGGLSEEDIIRTVDIWVESLLPSILSNFPKSRPIYFSGPKDEQYRNFLEFHNILRGITKVEGECYKVLVDSKDKGVPEPVISNPLFRFTPNKYQHFLDTISYILNRYYVPFDASRCFKTNKDKLFRAKKNRYKCLFHFIESLFGELTEFQMRTILAVVIKHLPKSVRDIFDEDWGGGFRVANRVFEHWIEVEADPCSGGVISVLDQWDYETEYTEFMIIYRYKFESFAYKAFLEYCDEDARKFNWGLFL